jgi:amino acid adenylation domain-containing protein
LLQQSKTLLLDAYAHQQVPFEQIVDTLHPERSLNHNPLFQIMLVLQNNQQGVLDMPGLSLTQVEHEGVIAKFDLTLSASETADGLLLSWEYNTDLFEASRITRMGQHFAILLRAMLNAPDTPVFALEMLTPDERQQLRAPLQQSLPEFGGTDCIHQRFEHFAASTPEAIAVVFEDQAISYGELNARANRLAHYLRAQQSIRPDTLVGLCLERSVAMMVGLLAIVKAGAAYVPLDPDYPAARLAHMLADARLDCVMTLQHLRERAIGSAATAVLCLDDPGLQQALAQCPDSNIDPATSGISRASLAYVIFTSGSTGQPKGVMIGHGNITRLFDAARSRFDFNQRDVWSMFHSFAFDFSVWEIWGALAHGGKLVMVPYPVARSPADFYQLLLREQVTVLNQTPGSFVNLIEQDQQGGADSPEQAALALRYVIFGGEALNLATLAPWMEKHGDQQPQLINMYGITETTVHVTFRRIEQHMLATANGASYIGDPLPDLTLHIVNRALTLVPPGIVGEMLVGGAGLARGYLNQPELTAARFIHLPGLGQQRLYRSGDLAQRLPNGELNYIGRIDHQVKIRGYRIELGEIEHALASYSGIREVVVVARNDAGGEKILVAYLSLSEPAALPADSASANASLSAALRVHLAGLLPQFMVPSFFVVLPALPLNQNGKVDLKALPQPDASSMLGQYEAPQLEVERILAQVWSGLLNLAVEKIGRQANFFECGGNSFLAIQLSTRFAHAGYQLSVTDAMQHQTLAAMAAAAAPIASTASSSALQLGAVPILPNHAHSLRVSSEGRNRWNNNSLQELPADYDADCLGQALQLLITHHDALRLCHVQDDEGVWQAKIIAPPESTSFRVIQLGVLSDEQYRQQINDIMEQLMDSTHVGTGPVIQMCVLDFAGSRQPQLMTSINHYATDATSNFILAVNFKHIYEQLMAGQTVSLPGNSTSYFDYAHYLHRYMGTAECAAKLDYWLGGKRFTDTAIPLDFPDGRCAAGSFKVHNGVHRIAGIDSAFQSGAPSRASLQEVLMAAFMRTYALWSGKDFVHLNLIDSGRFVPGNELDISRTVGWMSGLYPLVMELNAAVDDVNAILSSVAQQLRSVPMDKSCGLLRFCHPDPLIRDKMAQIREPRINFNFLGHTWSNQQVDDGGIKQLPLPEAAQSTVDAQGNPYPDREHFLLFDIKVHDDYLLSNWDFSTRMHHAETIAWLDQTFAQNVTQMLALLK